jgi:hypothetical protein
MPPLLRANGRRTSDRLYASARKERDRACTHPATPTNAETVHKRHKQFCENSICERLTPAWSTGPQLPHYLPPDALTHHGVSECDYFSYFLERTATWTIGLDN